jgi:putative toxin-antitoxin system antitoxin component (TIGR02293 family)
MAEPAQSEYGPVLESLGGTRSRRPVESVLDIHRLLEQGMDGGAIRRLGDYYGLTNEDLELLLGLTRRTLQRRQKQDCLPPGETDRLWRAAVILHEATQLLGSRDKARSWLHRPLRALGGARPLEMLGTEAGYGEVRNILGRIEWGVWS